MIITREAQNSFFGMGLLIGFKMYSSIGRNDEFGQFDWGERALLLIRNYDKITVEEMEENFLRCLDFNVSILAISAFRVGSKILASVSLLPSKNYTRDEAKYIEILSEDYSNYLERRYITPTTTHTTQSASLTLISLTNNCINTPIASHTTVSTAAPVSSPTTPSTSSSTSLTIPVLTTPFASPTISSFSSHTDRPPEAGFNTPFTPFISPTTASVSTPITSSITPISTPTKACAGKLCIPLSAPATYGENG